MLFLYHQNVIAVQPLSQPTALHYQQIRRLNSPISDLKSNILKNIVLHILEPLSTPIHPFKVTHEVG